MADAGSLASERSPSPPLSATAGVDLGPDAIHGRVVDEQHRGLAGRVVAVGQRRATTDVGGRFALPGVPPVYELVIVEPNHTRATVYRGLTRRDPLLMHKPSEIGAHTPAHRATVTGRIAGGPFGRDNQARVEFGSEEGSSGPSFLGASPNPAGPDFRPLLIFWDGPDTISGDVVAQRTQFDPIDEDAGAPDGAAPPRRKPWEPAPKRLSSWAAIEHVTLHDGQTLQVDLAPVPLPRQRTRVDVHAQAGTEVTQLSEEWMNPSRAMIVAGGGTNPRTSEFEIADARRFGLSLCAAASCGALGLWVVHRRCGVSPDAPVTLTLHAPPRWTAPAELAELDAKTEFSWSGSDAAVYELELRDRASTDMDPSVDIYTTETHSTWPDLSALGLTFPVGTAAYRVKIAARGPYATTDDAVGPEGMGAYLPTDFWAAESRQVELRVVPPQPVGAEAAQCQYAYGTAIVCGHTPDIEQPNEFYMLAAINNSLRWFPEFANAIGVHCVRTCDQARAYVKARAEYEKAHPGFDANQPLEMGPPPPPPPLRPPPPRPAAKPKP